NPLSETLVELRSTGGAWPFQDRVRPGSHVYRCAPANTPPMGTFLGPPGHNGWLFQGLAAQFGLVHKPAPKTVMLSRRRFPGPSAACRSPLPVLPGSCAP